MHWIDFNKKQKRKNVIGALGSSGWIYEGRLRQKCFLSHDSGGETISRQHLETLL